MNSEEYKKMRHNVIYKARKICFTLIGDRHLDFEFFNKLSTTNLIYLEIIYRCYSIFSAIRLKFSDNNYPNKIIEKVITFLLSYKPLLNNIRLFNNVEGIKTLETFDNNPIKYINYLETELYFTTDFNKIPSTTEDDWKFRNLLSGILDNLSREFMDINRDRWGYNDFTVKSFNKIVEFIGNKSCLEIMAGNGLLSRMLKAKNINIVATTDNNSWELTGDDVTIMDALTSIDTYQVDCLIVSWIPYLYEQSAEIIKRFKGKYIVYLGEGRDGCCANNEFFDELNKNFSNYYVNLHNSWGLHNNIVLNTRKTLADKVREHAMIEEFTKKKIQQNKIASDYTFKPKDTIGDFTFKPKDTSNGDFTFKPKDNAWTVVKRK